MRFRFRAWYLAPIFALVALVAWAFASPVASSPDDDFHLASIWCAAGDHTVNCQPGDTAAQRRVPIGIEKARCFAQRPNKTAACQLPYLEQSQKPTVQTNRGSFQNNYPPVYYAVMGLLASPNIEVSVLLMRLLNIVLLVGITVALAALLPAHRRRILVAAWIVTMVPLGVFLIASTNPSAWALIGIGSAWIALLGYFESTDRGRRIALGTLFALSGVMAAGARGDSAVYLVMSVAVVIFLTFRRDRAYLLRAILPVALVVLALVFFFTSTQSGVAQTGLGPGPGGQLKIDPVTLSIKDFINVPSLWYGVFGGWGLGWLDTQMPGLVLFGATAGFILIAALGLLRTSWRKGLMVGAVFAVLWLLPTYVLVRGGNPVGVNVQPRYLLPLIILLAGLLLLEDRGGREVEFARVPVLVAGIGIGLANAVALYFNLRRYIIGAKGLGADLDGRGTWWWDIAISPMTVWVVGSLAFGGMLVVLMREVLRRRELVLA